VEIREVREMGVLQLGSRPLVELGRVVAEMRRTAVKRSSFTITPCDLAMRDTSTEECR